MSDSYLHNSIVGYTSSGVFQITDPTKARMSALRGAHIVLDGTIGSGKTTLGNATALYLRGLGLPAKFNPETINHTLLKLFYNQSNQENGEKPAKNYSLHLQLHMLGDCQQNYQDAMWFTGAVPESGSCGIAITERSVFGNAVFAALHYKKGGISKEEFDVYKESLQSKAPYNARWVVYLHVSVETAMRRIKKVRKRESESNIPADYMLQLEHAYYTQIYYQITSGHSNVIVVSNEEYYEAPQLLNMLLNIHSHFQFTEADAPDHITYGTAGTILQRMADYYEQFMKK
jgi:deoxyadenosine/deoxycytidine kinase